MKEKPVRKISVSLGDDMVTWLKRSAAKKRSTVSQVIREYLAPSFDARHAK
jgi:Arc/MetJ-type ribon-helix-helix transcriptional regulator